MTHAIQGADFIFKGLGAAGAQGFVDEFQVALCLVGRQHIAQVLAQQVVGVGDQGGLVVREHFLVAPVAVQHQQHVRDGLRDGAQPG